MTPLALIAPLNILLVLGYKHRIGLSLPNTLFLEHRCFKADFNRLQRQNDLTLTTLTLMTLTLMYMQYL